MEENLRVAHPNAIVCEGQYYYDYETAQQACPPGWRMPTIEEFEELAGCQFQDLCDSSLDFEEETKKNTSEAFKFLTEEIGMTLNGSIRWIEIGSDECRHDGLSGIHGDYWTTTEDDSDEHVVSVLIDARGKRVCRYPMRKIFYGSVRLIRDL